MNINMVVNAQLARQIAGKEDLSVLFARAAAELSLAGWAAGVETFRVRRTERMAKRLAGYALDKWPQEDPADLMRALLLAGTIVQARLADLGRQVGGLT